MVIFCGAAAAECAVAAGTIDQIDGHDHLFNPRCAGTSCQEALNDFQTSGNGDGSNPPVCRAHHYVPVEDLNNFQKNMRNLVIVAEDPILGRNVIVVVDKVGRVGKSVLVKCLHHCFPGRGGGGHLLRREHDQQSKRAH